jgi:hypothetical protein
MPYSQTNRTPETYAKYLEVVRLRAVGLSFQQIADRVGYNSRQAAHEAYKAAIKLWGTETTEELRVVENERLDHLWRATMGQLEVAQRNDDPDLALAAINTGVRVGGRRAALNGLDAPRQLEVAANLNGSIHTDIGDILRQRIGLAKAGQPLPVADDVIEIEEPPSSNGQHDA